MAKYIVRTMKKSLMDAINQGILAETAFNSLEEACDFFLEEYLNEKEMYRIANKPVPEATFGASKNAIFFGDRCFGLCEATDSGTLDSADWPESVIANCKETLEPKYASIYVGYSKIPAPICFMVFPYNDPDFKEHNPEPGYIFDAHLKTDTITRLHIKRELVMRQANRMVFETSKNLPEHIQEQEQEINRFFRSPNLSEEDARYFMAFKVMDDEKMQSLNKQPEGDELE